MRGLVLLALSACTFTPNLGHGPGDATGPGGEPLPIDAAPAGSDAHLPPPPIDAPPDAAPTLLPCPVTYILTDGNHAGSQYRVVSASASWAIAAADCEGDEIAGVTAPAHLIVMDDQPEAVFAWNQNNSDQWVGHSDRKTENTWLPVTNQPTVYTGPANGNDPSNDCLMITATAGETTAESCTSGHPYVCECDGRRVNPANF